MGNQVLVLDDDRLAAEWVVSPDLGCVLIRRSYDTPEHRAEALASLVLAA